jgi:hypothetical protein
MTFSLTCAGGELVLKTWCLLVRTLHTHSLLLIDFFVLFARFLVKIACLALYLLAVALYAETLLTMTVAQILVLININTELEDLSLIKSRHQSIRLVSD